MDTKRLYVDFHVLQTVPPSCVNRDDMGSPKRRLSMAVPLAPGYPLRRGSTRSAKCLPKKWPTWSRPENVP